MQGKRLTLRLEDSPPSAPIACSKPSPRLSLEEREELARCERVIHTRLSSYLDSAQSLKRIRDHRLYRDDFPNFEAYALLRWGWRRHYAYRLIKAADIVENILRPMGNVPLPDNESQVRPLTRISREAVKATWREVVRKSGSTKITAALVNEVITNLLHQTSTTPRPKNLSSAQDDIRKLLVEASQAVIHSDFELAQRKLAAAQIRVDVESSRKPSPNR